MSRSSFMFFFFNDTATTEIYTLSLHDALPICLRERAHERGRRTRFAYGHGVDPEELRRRVEAVMTQAFRDAFAVAGLAPPDRKSTRLNSSHSQISYAVFCLKKKKKRNTETLTY